MDDMIVKLQVSLLWVELWWWWNLYKLFGCEKGGDKQMNLLVNYYYTYYIHDTLLTKKIDKDDDD